MRLLAGLLFLLLIVPVSSSACSFWAASYGGSYSDYVSSIQQTSDGGYIVAGSTYSFGVGECDVWVLKLDENGNVEWQKAYGGSDYDWATSIQQTDDGGYIVAGYTKSFGAGGSDFWVLKLDESGNVEWQKTYGGSSDDFAKPIQQTDDGGYIVAGGTESFEPGWYDVWVLKLDEEGNVEWQKRYGGSDYDRAESIQQTDDGGYIVAGFTYSFGAGGSDFWVLKLDEEGNVEWQKTYGGSDYDWATSIQQTDDGGYIVAGYTGSFGAGNHDFWVLKLDESGNVEWQKTYGGSLHDEEAYSINQTDDGGYIVAGWTNSFGAGRGDIWILKIDSEGNIPGCGIVGESDAVVTISSVTVKNTNAEIYNTHATVTETDTSITYTNVSANYVCYAQLPIVDFTYEIEGMIVTFDASMSYDPDGNILSYEWEFGDGCNETTTSPIVNHTYSPGTYTVTLTVTDNDGLKNTTSKVIAISLEPWQWYDQNQNGKIDDQELINAILDWLNGQITDEQLINIILKWLS